MFFAFPIGDENPRERTPWINWFLIGLNIAAFLFTLALAESRVYAIALVPLQAADNPLTFLSSMFLHAGLAHLGGNMLFLWIFGDNVEDKLGHVLYLLFYVTCGIAASFLHIWTTDRPDLPVVGASGAISGVMGAYLVLFPRAYVRLWYFFFFLMDVLLIPALLWIGFWFLQQLILASAQEGGGVAYTAHVGGFLTGLTVGLLVKHLRFGTGGLSPLPREVRYASRPARPSPISKPVVTIEKDAEVLFLDEIDERFAVLRATDDLFAIHRIAKTVARETEESIAEVQKRLVHSRGVVARGLSRIAAERIAARLRWMDMITLVVPDTPATHPPEAMAVERFSWDSDRFTAVSRGRSDTYSWSAPFLYVGARIAASPTLDIFATPRARYPLHRTTDMSPHDLRDAAAAILEYRRGAAMNDGVRVLAYRGQWGYLSFRSSEDYEEYIFWLYSLILARRPILR